MSFEDRMEKKLKERREASWKSYWALKHICKNYRIRNVMEVEVSNETIPLRMKIEILDTCTLPVLYPAGVDLWSSNLGPDEFAT